MEGPQRLCCGFQFGKKQSGSGSFKLHADGCIGKEDSLSTSCPGQKQLMALLFSDDNRSKAHSVGEKGHLQCGAKSSTHIEACLALHALRVVSLQMPCQQPLATR